ncbi:hypothetical protein SELMODRAFT_128933 [Selaginella moellendorffii]|uniref:Uncharacterized protein n=1 Tax=Selaginella moellendorffii TaxID=88036 RepID=D8SZZ6_SELML|nr:GDSL esterase/lipase At4g28780 [Selaginella moellendorffii]XP_024518510.1 GDSL esterase/lipase At4g28780 [Selaginella moellendorffii]EFJ09992.1 hypothetical protein SELMODRAFT_128933 [Selaginella moellendorffii]|eukprot:XP_002988963.1 GDSL esterase/lipase At4g28780 [Selaginella moellendorffii]
MGDRFRLLLIIASVLSLAALTSNVYAALPLFVFGDSLVDSGNNNFIPSLARANFPPNGIDLPSRTATGRFGNGKIVSDIISDYMGVPSVLEILSPFARGANLLRGANFASAGAGILEDTGVIFVQRLTIPDQFRLFQEYKGQITSLVGPAAAARIVADGLYSFTIGGNDYINNYLLPVSVRAAQFSPAQFNTLLIATLRQQLRTVYALGARKVTVGNIGPIGCIPSQLSQRSRDGQCVQQLNDYVLNFNALLKNMLVELNQELPGALFAYLNGFDILKEYIDNPAQGGFAVSNKACCGQGPYNGVLVCTALSNLCPDRSKYVFWDAFHPSQSFNYIFTNRIINGGPNDISPVNLAQILAMP